MENEKESDGVYIGRYVLIDYGMDDGYKNPSPENLSRYFYLKPNTEPVEIYTSGDYNEDYRTKLMTSVDDLYEEVNMQDANEALEYQYYERVV
jgi:hypothetical protein